jgi:hypothetical protein
MSALSSFVRAAGLVPLAEHYLSRATLTAARRAGLQPLMRQLEGIVPDLTEQYSNIRIESPRFYSICRANHAFQMRLLLKAVDGIAGDRMTVVDIGDSSGTHMLYLRALRSERRLETMSVNLDARAVEKIRSRGLKAIHCAAEDLALEGKGIDLFVSFEMVEHLLNPALFFHRLAVRGQSDRLLITVPFVRTSRVGLYSLRTLRPGIQRNAVDFSGFSREAIHAENEHIFELAPDDWKTLMIFSGWKPRYHEVFEIAPRFGFYSPAHRYWSRTSFTGFLGIYAERDLTAATRYVDWPD